MESSLSSLQSLVSKVKNEMFLQGDEDHINVYNFVSPSAYETAWLAMIPHPKKCSQPMFESCLIWIINNQNEQGFWGEVNEEGFPSIDTLSSTLACMVALATWHVGEQHITKGLDFVYSKAEIILKMNHNHLPRWFTITFPAMIELAQGVGLDVVFPQGSIGLLSGIFCKRQQILETESVVDDEWQYQSPILSHLECLPHVEDDIIQKNLKEDGSIFQSPSATARAYMATGNLQSLKYLKAVVERCPTGVPTIYPMDEDLIKLCMVDQVQRLGLAEHFDEEIQQILKQVYRNYKRDDFEPIEKYNLAAKLFKEALAFRLLRMQGYDVNPCGFCWFLSQVDVMDYMEQHFEHLTTSLYAIYKATELRFMGENEVEEARSFSSKLLQKSMALMNFRAADDVLVIFPALHEVIKHELSLPWITRLDHLDHALWIEVNKISPLWTGKASFYRLSCLHNEKLMQLASKNYNFRQSIYAKELEELTRWSKESGFAEIGFGREKTSYCYFAASASSCLPHDSPIRLLVTKGAIIITVADDFYDMEGSPTELKLLTEAVQRWDGKNLYGHGKTIFNALDEFVTQTAAKYQHHHHHGRNFLTQLRDIWKETFASWMVERRRSYSGYQPSMDEYLNTGMVSIAVHTLILPASAFLTAQTSPNHTLIKPSEYPKITKLTMTVARLLNDTQSYQKELLDGKTNYVLLHLKENPGTHLDDSITFIKHLLGEKTKEILELVLMDDTNGPNYQTPKSIKQLHLSCIKVFHMFFNSTNLFDDKTQLLHQIKKAIYVPLHSDQPSTITTTTTTKPSDLLLPSVIPEKQMITKTSVRFDVKIKCQLGIGFMATSLPRNPISMSPMLLRKFA